MTSASELFQKRRSRIGRNPELGFGGPSIDRLPPNHHNRSSHSHRSHHRHEGDCDPFRRSCHGPQSPSARHHLCQRVSQTDREPTRLDHNTSQSGTGNSGGIPSSSGPTNRQRFTRNDRLPGAVLQARARLLERLRGVSLTGNRHRSRGTDISQDEFPVSDDFRIFDTGDWESDILREWSQATAPFITLTRGGPPSPLLDTTMKKPPGLTLEAINGLEHEVFNIAGGYEAVCAECSICLEGFQEGDALIRLPCTHRFHASCLDPWIRTCGDCPCCRTGVLVDCGIEKMLDAG